MNIMLSECARVLGAALVGADACCHALSVDTRRLESGALFVALHGPNHNGHDHLLAALQGKAAGALVSEDVEIAGLAYIKVNDTQRALQTLVQYWRRKQRAVRLAAVTGSCGKTTVRAMLESILQCHGAPYLASRKSYNNDIGVPLTLANLEPKHQYAVLEMGGSHSGDIARLTHLAMPQVAAILNAAPVHLEGFGDIDGVACAKGEILQGLDEDGVAVLNADDRYLEFWRRQAGERTVLTFGVEHPADISASEVHLNDELAVTFHLHALSQVADISLNFLGEHNVLNALAAAAIGLALQIPFDSIVQGLRQAKPESGRLNRHHLSSGMIILDDTYNSNPQAMAAAIDLLAQSSRPTVLVMGDMAELGDDAEHYHTQIGAQAKAHGVQKLYAIGELSAQAVTAFGVGGQHFANCAALIAALQAQLKPDNIVLLKASRSVGLEAVVSALKKEG